MKCKFLFLWIILFFFKTVAYNYDLRINFSFKDLDDLTYFIQENAMAIPDTLLYVNGENIQLKPFLQGILKEVVTGFVKNLKGIEEPLREINIKIKF